MTLCVYRDGIVATDSNIHVGNQIVGDMKKCTKSPSGWVGAGAGGAVSLSRFLDWMDKDMPTDVKLTFPEFEGFVVDPKGNMFYMETDGIGFQIKAKWLTTGAGAATAIGALEMGATAEQAVRAAMKHVSNVGGRIHTVSLGE